MGLPGTVEAQDKGKMKRWRTRYRDRKETDQEWQPGLDPGGGWIVVLFTELEKAHKGIEILLFLLWEPEKNSVTATEVTNL